MAEMFLLGDCVFFLPFLFLFFSAETPDVSTFLGAGSSFSPGAP